MRICVAHREVGTGDGSSRFVADVTQLLVEAGHDVVLASRAWTRPEPATAPVVEDPPGPFDVLLGSDAELLRRLRPRARRFVYIPLDVDSDRWALQACDVVLRCTDAARAWLEEDHGLDVAGKCIVAPYVSRAFEDEPWGSLARPRPAELLWVGRLLPTKDVAFLVRAVARVRAPQWVLNVCGTGPESSALAALSARLGLADRVRFLGHVPDVRALYRRASVFLTASRLDHFQLALMEAYACGTPCIGRRPDGRAVRNACDVQILEGQTGYLVNSEEEMAERVERLLGDESLRRRLAAAGRERKRRSFPFGRFRTALYAASAIPIT
jgi:glycosyltransferase involved in cell wall biosynthesis